MWTGFMWLETRSNDNILQTDILTRYWRIFTLFTSECGLDSCGWRQEVMTISCKQIYELGIGGYSLCLPVNVDWIHVVGDRK